MIIYPANQKQKSHANNASMTFEYGTENNVKFSQRFTTATKFNEEEESTECINVNGIQTSADLTALKRTDPFMYHSIPAVRANVLQGKDVDVSTVAAVSAGTPVVQRRRRISYESIDGHSPSEAMMRQMINEAQRKYWNADVGQGAG